MDLDIEVMCENKTGKLKPGYAFLPHVSLFSQLDPTAYYRKGGACAEFYIPFSYTTENWEVCQSSNNPHNWWRPTGDYTALVWTYITRNEEFKCSGEELDGKQLSDIEKVDDDPCYECCKVDENGELQYDDDDNCIGTYDDAGNCTSYYFTLGDKQDEKVYECTLPLVDEQGNPIEYRDPDNYNVILPPPSNYYCCELDVDNNYAVIEETCGFWPADCSEHQ